MTFKEKPLAVAPDSGLKNPNGKQIEHSHYTTHGDPLPDKLINAVDLVSRNWPKPSEHLKAATALAGGLMRSGWNEDRVKSLLDAISEKTGMDVHIPSQAITFVSTRIQKGEKFFGWPKLIELTNQEMVSQLIEELGLRKHDSNESKSSFEILDESSIELTRPLALIDGRGYAASWLTIRRKVAQTTDEDGKITIHNPPKEITEIRLLIMRDDGELFNTDENPLSNLGFKVNLNESPPAPKLWSPKGVILYQEGERAYPKTVFEKLCDVIDTFIDFDRSLADQRTMCEFISCFILATWFLDAFKVISQLYLNGERGSGKTQLLTLISQTSYLGQITLAGSSFASIRDIVDSGSTLCLDEAENLDPQKLESNKRELLLSGNRRGSSITLKKGKGQRDWLNRYVNIYSAKVFAAIERPDAVLASKVILISLVRSANREKSNLDPQDFTKWPHDYQMLKDDLWSLALANLGKLVSYEAKVNELSSLQGRLLEPWRSILAVALWLKDQGVEGLWERMNKISDDYQKERQEFDKEDINTLIIRALCKCIGCEVVKLCEVNEVDLEDTKVFVLTDDIASQAVLLITELDLEIPTYEINSRKIGKKLSKLRFKKDRQGGTGKAGWWVSQRELGQWIHKLGIQPL